ncbi:MAG: adenosylcobinamide kinase [Acidobacteria bacterium]|nr:MAG: adenosylcobinamide kinase [Acidobacteriota bacterium]
MRRTHRLRDGAPHPGRRRENLSMTTTLVLGGPRSGKSRHAEALHLAARIARHQERRPRQWRTVETLDLTRALLGSRQPVLIDDLGGWLRGLLDEESLWSHPHRARQLVDDRLDELSVAMRAVPFDVVAVTNDPSWVRLPDDPAERLYVDLLGQVNHRISAVSHNVYAVMAGRVLDLSSSPVVGSV